MKIYFIRHQAGGILWDQPFLQEPSIEQCEAMAAQCGARFGMHHPKTEQPYWLRVVEVDALNEGDMPRGGEPDARAKPGARIVSPDVELAGVATIKNPKG